jgi:hypothetical protein
MAIESLKEMPYYYVFELKEESMKLLKLLFLIIFAAGVTGEAMAQGFSVNPQGFMYVNEEGDIFQSLDPYSDNAAHVHGYFNALTADYFRGTFDGVQEDLGDWSFVPAFAFTWTMEEMDQQMSVTAGIHNGLSDESPFANLETPGIWYEADLYAGLTKRITGDNILGLTYTYYASPNDAFSGRDELALAWKYVGAELSSNISLNPNAKFVLPLEEDGGFFLQFGISPAVRLYTDTERPLTLTIPADIGFGFDDYLGADDNLTSFLSTGLIASVPLTTNMEYGRWHFNAGVKLLMREQSLIDIGGGDDDAGNMVVIAGAGVNFAY